MLRRFSLVQLFAAPLTVACRVPLSKGFFRQEYWSEWPCPPPGDLPNPGTEPRSPTLQADSLPAEPPETLLGIIPPKSHDRVCLALLSCLIFTLFTPWAASRLGCGCGIVSRPGGSPAASHRPCCALRLGQCGTWAPRPLAAVPSALGLSRSTAHGIFVV